MINVLPYIVNASEVEEKSIIWCKEIQKNQRSEKHDDGKNMTLEDDGSEVNIEEKGNKRWH